MLGAARGKTIRHFLSGSNAEGSWEAIEGYGLGSNRAFAGSELDVLRLIGIGRSNKQIAHEFGDHSEHIDDPCEQDARRVGCRESNATQLIEPVLAMQVRASRLDNRRPPHSAHVQGQSVKVRRGQAPTSCCRSHMPIATGKPLQVVVDLNRCQSYTQYCFLAPEVFELHGQRSPPTR